MEIIEAAQGRLTGAALASPAPDDAGRHDRRDRPLVAVTENRRPRAPSLLDALLPVVVLIGLIALTIGLFGVSAK